MGPGLNEAVYKECMTLELASRGIPFECDVAVPASYKGRRLKNGGTVAQLQRNNVDGGIKTT
jgi:GxxExxY protein